MKITQDHVGKKVILLWWTKNGWQKVLCVGEQKFFTVDEKGDETSWINSSDWQLVEEKETV